MSAPRLILITPEEPSAAILRGVRAAFAGARDGRALAGVALQLRAKHLSEHERAELGQALCQLTRAAGVALIVNGDLALAARLGAEGVQLPERGPSVAEARAYLGARTSVGVSRHDAAGVERAAAEGASYAVLGPVHAVPGKGPALGVDAFARIAAGSALPLVALGGVTRERAPELLAAGAAGLAVMREVFAAPEPGRALSELLGALGGAAAP